GVTIDKDTGEITVTIPGDAKPGDKITVPVVVTYPDGSKDTVDVTVTVEKPEAPAPKQNEEFEPGYEDGSGKPGEDVKVPAPGFKDKDGKDTKAPEGTKFTPGENAPGGVTIDKDTGEITVTIPGDAKPGDKITVPVVVTYPDGSKDTVDVTVTVEEPEAPAEKPDWNDDKGQPGDKVEIPNTGGPVEDGTTVETEGPGKAEIDEDGKITVDIDKDAKPGDKIVVVVKDKDGNEIDRVVVEVEKPEAPAEKPDWNDDKGQPGDKVEIPNTGGPVEDGTTVETEGPGKAEIDEDGKITVDIDKDAKPGDKVVVIVKDKDGNEIDRVVVEVEKPADKPAEKPDWKDNSGKPGENVVIPNEGGKVPEGSTVETEGPGKAEIDEDGNLVVDINDDAKPGDKVTVVVKDKDGKVIDTVTVTVEKPEAPAEQPAPGGNDNGTAQPKPGTSNGNGPVKRVPLPRTGAEVAGVAGAAAALIAAGLGLVFSRRRREGEEN
ncbi:YPDG domain-containing protein, partial [Dermabacter hominis]|uniref:YPDG domain-containing protein n=1 Tax=Dermabacter hominis TaxID=36740 RepID=UPI00316AD78B|nr:YPDG domain-containing protein [Dermabacter hominis]